MMRTQKLFFLWTPLFLLFMTNIIIAQEGKEITYPIICDGLYKEHLQGVTTDGNALFWSFTDTLVKTDFQGSVKQKVVVDDHHGDLCFIDGKIYVAVNLGEFNKPAGKADSWVYVYDAMNLALLHKHPVPEVVHGAGGIAVKNGTFYVVGGLPHEVNENYVYAYTPDFTFKQRYVILSGHTHLGIQTVDFIDGAWYFGCYGDPRILIKTDPEFNLIGKWDFDAAYGITSLPDGPIIVARGIKKKGLNGGKIFKAKSDKTKGLILPK